MEINKILSADVLDIIFDDRNKEYGAYDLRRSYNRRIIRALLITSAIALLAFLGAVMANATKRDSRAGIRETIVELIDIKPDEKKIEIPPPIKKIEPPQVEMKKFTPPVLVKDEDMDKPMPTVDDLKDVRIADVDIEGIKDIGIPDETKVDDGRKIIDQKIDDDKDEPYMSVQVEASFPGGDRMWIQYLERYCNGQVAFDNGAPEGKYTVMVQFVVDKEGKISDVKALTNHGYGMEEEAVRVIRKGPNWNAAFQNGVKVKAYRKQPITFQVSGE